MDLLSVDHHLLHPVANYQLVVEAFHLDPEVRQPTRRLGCSPRSIHRMELGQVVGLVDLEASESAVWGIPAEVPRIQGAGHPVRLDGLENLHPSHPRILEEVRLELSGEPDNLGSARYLGVDHLGRLGVLGNLAKARYLADSRLDVLDELQCQWEVCLLHHLGVLL